MRDQEIGGYVIPAGAAVLMPTFVMNRDPRLYPDPLRFDPERFLGEAAAARPDWAYPLFGGGTRKCIGVGFAMLEAVLVIAELARRFRLRLDPGPRPSCRRRASRCALATACGCGPSAGPRERRRPRPGPGLREALAALGRSGASSRRLVWITVRPPAARATSTT